MRLAWCWLAAGLCGTLQWESRPVYGEEKLSPHVAAIRNHGDFPAKQIRVGQVMRTYRLCVPKSVDLAQPVPLWIAFHGLLVDSKDLMPRYSRLSQTADRHGFIVAYPAARTDAGE